MSDSATLDQLSALMTGLAGVLRPVFDFMDVFSYGVSEGTLRAYYEDSLTRQHWPASFAHWLAKQRSRDWLFARRDQIMGRKCEGYAPRPATVKAAVDRLKRDVAEIAPGAYFASQQEGRKDD